MRDFDIIVVGAGHAGIEACTAAARMKLKTLMITNNLDRVGYMSCNPSIGGLGKGHMVKEIDALGGEMAVAADSSCIQFKRLNARKGPAVRGSRAQCDKDLYSQHMSDLLRSTPNLSILLGEVESLKLEGKRCDGVVLKDGSVISSQTVVITTGTFMNAVMHFGLQQIAGGRIGDKATKGISDQMADFGFSVTRLKTGTPPRLSGASIDWSKTEKQFGDKDFIPFSYRSSRQLKNAQIACYLAYTNEQTHDVIRKNLDKSPMFTGAIEGIGPRYCPSIEDKITRFADKDRHQTFLEPEGIGSNSIYLQGISTSLPEEVQYEFLRTIPGLESVEILRPGYAVEYDFVDPGQLYHSLETRLIENLFLAGQINGTSGYEEAAAQGLVAGINAGLKVRGQNEFILDRDEAYIGVLIDDLITKGTKEPYRMMTSRAEYRLVLREDNNLDRLAHRGFEVGSMLSGEYGRAVDILDRRAELTRALETKKLVPNAETLEKLQQLNTPVIQKPTFLKELLRRNEIQCSDLKVFEPQLDLDPEVAGPVEIAIKYEGYISRQLEIINQMKRLEKKRIPADIQYIDVRGLSNEEVEKLSQIMPRTLGQAGRISGVNPSAIQALLVHLKGRARSFSEVEL